jgi:SPP1 gp7 family putative phage head morphogenesis protein
VDHVLARYNVQKRATLDRLTLRYRLQSREILRRETEGLARDVRDSLNAGKPGFHPKLPGLADRLEGVFWAHREKVVHVAVSDGIQEVSPGKDYELAAWDRFPVVARIEDTLSPRLASERDKIRDALVDKWAEKHQSKILDLAAALFDDYLSAIKKAYRLLSGDWIAGESTSEEVVLRLQRALQVSDSSAERIFRTETTNYFNETRQDYFATQTAVDYIELYAVTDGRISKICEDRHQAVVTIAEARLKKYMPAFHPHCRTIQRPLISALSSHKRIIDAGLALRAAYEPSWTPIAWAG